MQANVKKGGNLYISGPIGNERLQKLLGVSVTGITEHDFTYMSPTEKGRTLFEGFEKTIPVTIDMPQVEIEIEDDADLQVLATQTLPYTMTNTEQFAAIHSNPPGIYTEKPCAILKNVGESKIIWVAAPIELAKPYMSRQVFRRMIQSLEEKEYFVSNAPKFVEVINWEKEGFSYFAILNEQEESPIVPMYDITLDVEDNGKDAYILPEKQKLKMEKMGNGKCRIYLPKLEIMQIIVLQ